MVRAWHGRGMASVNQTRTYCVNQMGKTHSKPLAARHGRGTASARHAMCESALRVMSGHLTGRTGKNTKMLSERLMFWSRFERGTSSIQIGSVAA